MLYYHKYIGQLIQNWINKPKPGRRRPKPNKDLFVTKLVMKILAQE